MLWIIEDAQSEQLGGGPSRIRARAVYEGGGGDRPVLRIRWADTAGARLVVPTSDQVTHRFFFGSGSGSKQPVKMPNTLNRLPA